jgi:hypothetical protein
MEKLLMLFGAISAIIVIGYSAHYFYNKVKFKLPKNPVKSYIRKQVLEYLKELQND